MNKFECKLKTNSPIEKLKECIHPMCSRCVHYKPIKKAKIKASKECLEHQPLHCESVKTCYNCEFFNK